MLTLLTEPFQLRQLGAADFAQLRGRSLGQPVDLGLRLDDQLLGLLGGLPGDTLPACSPAILKISWARVPRAEKSTCVAADRASTECPVELGVLAGQGLATLLQGGDPILRRVRETIDCLALISLANQGKTAGTRLVGRAG